MRVVAALTLPAGGAPGAFRPTHPAAALLRVYRREDGERKVAHRHGDTAETTTDG